MNRLSSNADAARRLREIEAEMTRIVAVFPELRRSGAIPTRIRLTRPTVAPVRKRRITGSAG